MGKRSTTSTKSGKFMNPTDQARKEARRRELKKNKKQRVAVRQAVLKGKDPRQIVAELEKLDDMEFNVLVPPPLNDKVLKDKRRKLHETWHRVMRMYETEKHEQFIELKRLWHSYMNRKAEVVAHFESVQNAKKVSVDEIPLPSLGSSGGAGDDVGGGAESIPLPPAILQQQQPKGGILKKPSVLDAFKPKTCPGVPACPPPNMEDYGEDDEDSENKKEETSVRAKKIRFDDEKDDDDAEEKDENKEESDDKNEDEDGPKVNDLQKKMLAMAGQDVDQYMKQMEEVHRQTQQEKANELQKRLDNLEEQQQQQQPAPLGAGLAPPHVMMAMQQQQQQQQQPPPPPPIMYRTAPPPLRPGMAPASVRLPPGPPPGRPPMAPPMPGGAALQAQAMAAASRQQAAAAAAAAAAANAGVLSAAPQLKKDSKSGDKPSSGVIEAKPQMRNLKSDITRFVPTNVKIRREGGGGAGSKRKQSDPMSDVFRPPHGLPQHRQQPQPQQIPHPHLQQQQLQQQQQQLQQQQQQQPGSKDDAYAQFMAEMDQLMK